MSHVTLKDVAKASGFSVTTVSRALTESGYPISPQARAAINKAAKELGYVPNLLARSLKTHISKEMAVIVPSITNPFYTSMVMGIQHTLAEQGYNMLVYLTSRSEARDTEWITGLRGKLLAGVIIAADCITPSLAACLQSLKQSGIPLVVTDYAPEMEQPPVGVFFDYRHGGQMAAQYLLRQGHRRIAFVSSSLDKASRLNRKEGFCQAMAAAGVPFGDPDIFVCDLRDEFQAGTELARRVLECGRPYTAIAACNDAMAMGVLAVLAERGFSLPGEMSVMGFDDCIFSRISTPLLTTVQVPAEEIGRMSANFILDEIGPNKVQYSIYLEPKIIERHSVQKIDSKGEIMA